MTRAEIRQARCFLGLSRAEFAAALGVKERTVVAWEYGENKPSGAVLKAIDNLQHLKFMQRLVVRVAANPEETRK